MILQAHLRYRKSRLSRSRCALAIGFVLPRVECALHTSWCGRVTSSLAHFAPACATGGLCDLGICTNLSPRSGRENVAPCVARGAELATRSSLRSRRQTFGGLPLSPATRAWLQWAAITTPRYARGYMLPPATQAKTRLHKVCKC